ncbi:MAG: helix-turn-helix domain-containing protein [Acidobacteria bacterium]|nr:helix-turn-helix domain-containing protein [Acidobacteriota bacterium]
MRRDFGSWLRARREEMHLSQQGVADKVGVDRQTIYRIESGTSGTSRETVIAIAQVLRINVDEALIRSGYATPAFDRLDPGSFKGVEKLTPDQRVAVRRAMQALIDSLAAGNETTDYIEEDETRE